MSNFRVGQTVVVANRQSTFWNKVGTVTRILAAERAFVLEFVGKHQSVIFWKHELMFKHHDSLVMKSIRGEE